MLPRKATNKAQSPVVKCLTHLLHADDVATDDFNGGVETFDVMDHLFLERRVALQLGI